jgi:prepilin-type N-terminal cleavage/methylation domain-containing protein
MNASIHRFNRRQGFTLVELLLVISILAVLSTLTVGLLLSAREDAAAARTRSLINRIQMILRARLENYEERNLPFRYEDILGNNPTREQKEALRSNTFIEWLIVEMPEHVEDFDNTFLFPFKALAPPVFPITVDNGAYALAMNSRLSALHIGNQNYLNRYGAAAFESDPDRESSKLLYMILYNSWDGENRGTHFLQPDDIRVHDGVPYIVDSYGDPLQFKLYADIAPNDELRDAHLNNVNNVLSLENIVIEISSNKLN